MNQEQLAALAKGLAPVVRECVAAATAPLLEQIDALHAEVATLKGVDHSGAIATAVTEAVAAMPPLIDERVSVAVSEAVKALPAPKDGKDGVGVAGALIDRDGGLVLTLTDGTQRDLGAVVGKDGDPGKDGMDGLGFDDMDMVVADDGVALVFARGEQKKAFALPIVFDRGVFKAETSYRKGNGVTWGGQFWIAQKDSPEGKPDASGDWRLAVKKGRDASRHAAKVEVQP